MSRLALIKNFVALIVKGEGDYRPGPYYLPVTGGWLPADVGSYMNWWQLGYNPISNTGRSAMVEACVSAYSQTVAMCPGTHWLATKKGGRERVTTSSLSRVLKSPNDYQTASDFMLNLVRWLYLDGNGYALALRNSRYEIDELHLLDSNLSYPMVAQTGDIFYNLCGYDVIEKRLQFLGYEYPIKVPARDVLHVRFHTGTRLPKPLVGESPISATYGDIGVGAAIAQQQAQFYLNEARPSAVLSTDLTLDKDQTQALRDKWNDQAKGLHKGGTPILTHGLKVMPWTIGGKDAATAEILKLSNDNIALAFRIPMAILGVGGLGNASTEAVMQFWLASGLGFALNHVETAFDLLYELKGYPEEYIELDTSALLRIAMKDRIESLVRGVQGAVFSPNEARNVEGYDSVEYGDEPRVQQQVVPLSAAASIPAAPGPPSPEPAAPVDAESPPPEAGSDDDTPPKPKDQKDVAREVKRLIASANRIAQRRLPT